MSIDMDSARDFMATHARTLDRRRFELLDGGRDTAGALAALDGYRNPDGGYGWGLEGDLRSPESQPAAALHAFEVFAETGRAPQAATLCHWLDAVTLADGGLPMALPMAITAGSGPWWAGADATESSLQITSVVAARAWRGRRARPRDRHAPLARARDRLHARARSPARGIARRLRARVLHPVPRRRPRASAPRPPGCSSARRVRARRTATCRSTAARRTRRCARSTSPRSPEARPAPCSTAAVVEADLDRLASGQQEDGGWTVDFVSPLAGGQARLARLRDRRRRSPCCSATAAQLAGSGAASRGARGAGAARWPRRRPTPGAGSARPTTRASASTQRSSKAVPVSSRSSSKARSGVQAAR